MSSTLTNLETDRSRAEATRSTRTIVVRRIVIALVLMAASVWISSEAWGEVTRLLWLDEQSSHGLIVPLAVFLLVAARRSRLEMVRVEPHWLGPVIVAIGMLSSAISWHLDLQTGWHGGALLMALGCWVTMTGTDLIRKFAPAYIALIFLLPTPAAIRTPVTVPLQDITATITKYACEMLGMGVTQAGRTLRVNGQDVTVAEACSGMRMVFTLLLACFISVYSLPLREWVRWLVLLSTPVIAVVANVIRLVPTLWAYGRFSTETADQVHNASGWIMVVLAYFAVEGALKLFIWVGVPLNVPRRDLRTGAA
jgi:exosortase